MKKYLRCLCFAVAAVLIMAVPVYAADVSPRSSSYGLTCNSNLKKTSDTTFVIWFQVVNTEKMDEIGALSIRIEKSKDKSAWSAVHTYYNSSYPQMYSESAYEHTGNMIYTAEKGYYYRAIVTFYAENSSGSETVTYYTEPLFMPNTGRQIP